MKAMKKAMVLLSVQASGMAVRQLLERLSQSGVSKQN